MKTKLTTVSFALAVAAALFLLLVPIYSGFRDDQPSAHPVSKLRVVTANLAFAGLVDHDLRGRGVAGRGDDAEAALMHLRPCRAVDYFESVERARVQRSA